MKPYTNASRYYTCVAIDDEPHALSELEEVIDQIPGIELLKSFSNIKDAIAELHLTGEVDIIFSDINMPGLSGIESAKLLQNYCRFLVYVTAYRDFAIDAIQRKVNGYLMKPLSYIQVSEQINSLREEESEIVALDNFIFVKGDHKHSFFKVFCDEIIYIKGMLNYVQVHTIGKQHITYSLLKEIESDLKKRNMFIRINKSVIISIVHLNHIEGNMAFMDNGDCFTVGMPYREKLTNFLKERRIGSRKV